MKKILGLDLGVASIGWAYVYEAEKDGEQSSIKDLGVRVVPLSTDESTNFEKGKSITTNADRTLKRSMRRNNQRYKLRRDALINILQQHGLIDDNTILTESGSDTTFETWKLRAKAATEEISLQEFARVLLMINNKRGYLSNRKVQNDEEGELIDGINIAKILSDRGMTPGEYTLELLEKGTKTIPAFYRSDLENELDRVWECQRSFYQDILTDALKDKIRNKNKSQTWSICREPFNIVGIKRQAKGKELTLEDYRLRVKALTQQLDLERLAIVIQNINGQITGASGYLGKISDRSKELHFGQQTVGQYLKSQLDKNPNSSLKNQVFYRQDYKDEFERIWETQAKYHTELTPELKEAIGKRTIFYQRPLKSQKGLVSLCEFEHRDIEIEIDGVKKTKTIGLKVCPKSSPLFQEFKVWQIINNLLLSGPGLIDEVSLLSETQTPSKERPLTLPEKEKLYKELLLIDKMKGADVLKILFGKRASKYKLNYKEVEGNRTNAELFKAYKKIYEISGYDSDILANCNYDDTVGAFEEIFKAHGWDTGLLHFDSSVQGQELEMQPFYRLWHLIYSYEGDESPTGNDTLARNIQDKFGFDEQSASVLAKLRLQDDYGSLSSKAIRKILPFLKQGYVYNEACEKVGYRHSPSSLTKEEVDNKQLVSRLELLPKNSLRNPVVEKILNQMINVVNCAIETYGCPDEIRIEMARELKKSQKEREQMSKDIATNTNDSEKIRERLIKEFSIPNPSRNDIIRYKLYEELKPNGYKTLYSNTYISEEELFGKRFDIEHIIPQSRRFDDSISNKTLELGDINREKGNRTALDFVRDKYGDVGVREYKMRVEAVYADSKYRIKIKNLTTTEADIPEGFLMRDLRDSQYIAKKAREILELVTRRVTTTTGAVTSRLRQDWQLVDTMKELNWDKYDKLGLTTYIDRNGNKVKKITDWTKRNDNRHHAMDALTIAFTKPSYIQYLNNLNARRDLVTFNGDEEKLEDMELSSLHPNDRSRVVKYIEAKEMHRDKDGHLVFNSPIALETFRQEALKHLSSILVSIKAKNKVVTKNTNVTKTSQGLLKKVQLTPRGQLHNETVYRRIEQYDAKEVTVGSPFDYDTISKVSSKEYRNALKRRLDEFGGNPKKAFTGKNSLKVNPIYLDPMQSRCIPEKVKIVSMKEVYTMRTSIDKDLKVDKVIDGKVKSVLTKRLEEYGNNANAAFSNLDENPIWLNKDKGISIKRVTITGKSNVEPIRSKRNNSGMMLHSADSAPIPTDYVSTANNHHIAIYKDNKGKLNELVVSFLEAVSRRNLGDPAVNTLYNKDEGWEFLFSMKKNEFFVFPNKDTGFDPNDIDLMDSANYPLISPNLFRVQKLTSKDYVFRHHLETTVDSSSSLKNITWKRITNLEELRDVVKVRIDHLGKIVHIGE